MKNFFFNILKFIYIDDCFILFVTVDAVKLKWKNLRDSYVKYLKYLKGGTGSAKKFKNWPWATHLEFLKDSITPRQTVSNVPELSETEVVQVDEDTNDSGSVTNDDSQMPPPTKKLKPRKKQNEGGVDKILHFLQNKTDNKPKTHLDHTDHLFLSYADTFKKLSPTTQAVLKMEMAQMFGRAELADLGQNSPPFSPLSHSSNVSWQNPSGSDHSSEGVNYTYLHSANQPRGVALPECSMTSARGWFETFTGGEMDQPYSSEKQKM